MNATPLSSQLLKQQLLLSGKIFRRPIDDNGRALVFADATEALKVDEACRKRGRPRLNWAREIRRHALQINHGGDDYGALMADALKWKSLVHDYIRRQGTEIP